MLDADTFPVEILRTPQPLIALSGLEQNKAAHRRVWEVFTSNRGLDRHSLHFINLLQDSSVAFPPVKAKKSSYEWYVPKGVIKIDWIHKHQNLIPSVLVLFQELNWNDGELAEKARQCAERVKQIKGALQGRGTKICVVLLQDDSSHGDTDSVTNFCTECEISPRSLFVIGTKDLLSAVIRLEATLHELSQNYYHLEIKNVRSHKDALNKSSHMILMIRHMFKIGYLNEMKSDLHSAQKAYQTAYSLLLESKMNEFNVVEYKTIAGYVSYKISRLGFRLSLPRDAISHFRKHLDNFKTKTGVPELGWEHAAWQATQSAMFAQLFLDAHRNGQQAIQTQHPGIYFQLAADYAISRRKLAEEQCNQIQSYPQPDPLMDTPIFYGQRPWRPGKIEPVDLQREKEGIEALQYRERTKTKHSEIIIKLQESAIEQFESFSSPRMKNQVKVQMAEELMIAERYGEALAAFLPCVEVYRREGWIKLAAATLLKAIKCAFLTINVEVYVNLCLDLISPESESSLADKQRIEQNLFLVLHLKPPLPEPSLTGKSERASVGQAAKNWKEKLESMGKIVVTLPSTSTIDLAPSLAKSSKLGDVINVTLSMRNFTTQQVEATNIKCKMNIPDYNDQLVVPGTVILPPNGQTKVEINVKPYSSHLDQTLKVVSFQFNLKSFEHVVFQKDLTTGNTHGAIETRLIPRDSQIEVELVGNLPALIGEWFNLKLSLKSTEKSPASNLEVVCWLRDGGDPVIADTTDLSTFPGFPTTPTTPGGSQPLEMQKSVMTVPSLDPGGTEYISFFLRASTIGSRAVAVQLRYSVALDAETCVCSCLKVVEVEMIPVFEFSFSVLNQRLEETKQVSAGQGFMILPKVVCVSPHNLVITDSRLDVRAPLVVEKESHDISGSELCRLFQVEQGFPAQVPQENLITQFDTETVPLGKFHLFWKRKLSEIINETVFELQNIKVSRSFMSLKFRLPAYGILRTPAEASFEIINRTEIMQEYSLTMEPSESFMFSGPKQLRTKVFPWDTCTIRYVLYPLLTGNLVLPRLKILPLTSGGVASLDRCGTVEDVIATTLPTHFFVLPAEKCEEKRSLNLNYFELKEPTVIPNLPFSNCVKKAVKG